jgi:hypothetical protein
MIQSLACGHLDLRGATAKCLLSRGYPSECLRCTAYLPGKTLDDRVRQDAWQPVLDQMAAPSRAEIADSIEFVEQRIERQIDEIKAELERQDKAIQDLFRRFDRLAGEIRKNTVRTITSEDMSCRSAREA